MRTQLSGTSREILDYLDRHGASLFGDLRTATHKSLRALNDGLAELFWRGLITGDAFGEVLRLRRTIRQPDESAAEPVQILTPRHNPATFRMMQSARRSLRQVPGWSDRWTSLRHPGIWGEPQEIDLRASLQASGLLARYGIIAREMFRREELLPWSIVASHLQTMELRGEVRRGYFVAGLSGIAEIAKLVPPEFLPPTLLGDQLTLTWIGQGLLQAAPTVTGIYTNFSPPVSSSPCTITVVPGENRFFRLQATSE